jgi:hypothetical protein
MPKETAVAHFRHSDERLRARLVNAVNHGKTKQKNHAVTKRLLRQKDHLFCILCQNLRFLIFLANQILRKKQNKNNKFCVPRFAS